MSRDKKSIWLNNAQSRIENRQWLKYSSNIARRILSAIEEKEGFNQTTLAELLGTTPQNVSKILKGQENLSLKTIAKLAEAIGVELITFPDYKYSATKRPVLEYAINRNADDYSYENIENGEKFFITESNPVCAKLILPANNYDN